jgi:predicted permease
MFACCHLRRERTPERVTIGNALSIACSCGNVFPLVYAKLLSKEAQAKLLPATVMACQGVAFAAALLCALGWKVTAGQHSVVLLLCVFLTAGVGTLSNVTFWAYAGRNDGDHCTKALGNGMTVGCLVVTSAAVSIQQAGCSPRFSVAVFMIMVHRHCI